MANSLLSSLPFGSFLIYSPRGSSAVSQRSRDYCYAIKAGNADALRAVIDRLVTDFPTTGLDAVLGSDVTLVPAPRSAPLVTGGLWPSRLIAEALVQAGLGASVLTALTRESPVPKSAFQSRGARPGAMLHYDTISVEPTLPPHRLTVVDDVLTKGNTLLGAASRIVEVFPGSEVSAFALIRTMGLVPEVERIVEPCIGRIRSLFGDADRQP